MIRTKQVVLAFLAVVPAFRLAASQQVGRSSLEVQVANAPTAMFALGRVQLVYELRLSNFGLQAVELRQLDALDPAGGALGSWRDSQLAQRLVKIGAAGTAPQNSLEVLRLGSGQSTNVYLLIALPAGIKAPSSIHHRLIIGSEGRADTISTGSVRMSTFAARGISAPVGDGSWVAIRGPSNSSGHRLSIVVDAGRVAIPQRYAVDWAKLGPDGKLFSADSSKLENWYGYGSPVSAVGDGRVVWTRDGISEKAPFAHTPPSVIEAADAVGNAVIMDMGGGAFATFAHLKPGSIRVKAGDSVTAGQAIGQVGNSGNSLAPHLHFHLSDAPGVLAGDGLPFLSDFDLLGRISSTGSLLSGGAWAPNPAQPSRAVLAETHLENMVVRFRKR